jgi:hypothetical protein
MVTCDGAGASHGLIARLDKLASRSGCQLTYSVGWELGEGEAPRSWQYRACKADRLDNRGEPRR